MLVFKIVVYNHTMCHAFHLSVIKLSYFMSFLWICLPLLVN